MQTREIRAAIECREDETRSGPGLIDGVLIETGRVAGDKAEVFAPGSIQWPSSGIRLLAEHLGRPVMKFQPVEDGNKLRIRERLPDTELGREVAREIRSGNKTEMSIEFFSRDEAKVAGVREIRHALVDCVALVGGGSYGAQAKVELRERKRRRWLWL